MLVKRLIKLCVIAGLSLVTVLALLPVYAADQVLVNLSAEGNHYETPATIPLTAGQTITVAGRCTTSPTYNAPITYLHYIEVGAVPTPQHPEYNDSIYYKRGDCLAGNIITFTAPATANYRFIFHVHTTEYGCGSAESCPTLTGISHFNYSLRVTSATGTAATSTPTNTPIRPTSTPSLTATRIPPTATRIAPTATRISPTPSPVPPTATSIPSGTSTTISASVKSSSDDVNEVGTTFDAASSSIWIGNGGTTTTSFTGLRFTGIAIPRGAVITSAQLQFYSSQGTWIAINLQIAAETTGSSLTYSTTSRPSQRTALTTARVNHTSNVNWNANTWYTLADIKPVIQEVVNLPAWTSGNSISIILKGTGTNWGRKFASAFEAGSANAPRLVITYSK
jgi:hypothetical protein